MARGTSKEASLRFAKKDKREILWADAHGVWHASTNIANTPHWASEVEDLHGVKYERRDGHWVKS